MSELLLKWTKCLAALVCCGLLLNTTSADPDLFARLAVGRLADLLGYLPMQDPFSFSPKKAIWIDHEWLSGVIFFYVQQFFSEFGLFTFKLLACYLTICLLFEAALIREGGNAFYLFIAILLIAADSQYVWSSTVRSQIFTYLFLSLYLYLINKFEKEKNFKPLLLIPLTMVFWCNMHGGFVVGLGLYSLFAITRPKKELLQHFRILCLALFVTGLNPYGYVLYWNYIVEAVTMKRPSISEWQPIPFNDQIVLPLIILCLTIYALFRQRRAVHVYAAVILSAYFAFSHQRHLALFYFITFAFVPDLFKFNLPLKSEFKEKFKVTFTFVIAVFVIYFSSYFFGMFIDSKFELKKDNYPVAALDWLSANKKGGRLLVDFNNGSYAMWKLFPKFHISLDGRYEELYPESTLALVSDAYSCNKEVREKATSILKPDFALVINNSSCYQEYQSIYSDNKFSILEIKN